MKVLKSLSALAFIVVSSVSGATNAEAASTTTSRAFARVKDAYLVGIANKKNESFSGHQSWCEGVDESTCRQELLRFLDDIADERSRVSLSSQCYINARLKDARLIVTGKPVAFQSHYDWCMNNSNASEQFFNEERQFLRYYFN